jgi:hypothetical protein
VIGYLDSPVQVVFCPSPSPSDGISSLVPRYETKTCKTKYREADQHDFESVQVDGAWYNVYRPK